MQSLSAFRGFRFPPDVILLAVRWYLRLGLSYRDLERHSHFTAPRDRTTQQSLPIGTALGGFAVVLVEPGWGRTTALRTPFFVAAALGVLLMLYAVPRRTTAKLDTARAEGIAARAARQASQAK